eukprot:scaffold7028_cov243-Pinguiococcus_pyrenoidosus.AAC.14
MGKHRPWPEQSFPVAVVYPVKKAGLVDHEQVATAVPDCCTPQANAPRCWTPGRFPTPARSGTLAESSRAPADPSRFSHQLSAGKGWKDHKACATLTYNGTIKSIRLRPIARVADA